MSRAALIIKRNDKITAPGKEYLGLKHADPVEIISDADAGWEGRTLDQIIVGNQMHQAFGVIEIDPIVIPSWRAFIEPEGDSNDPPSYRPRQKRLNIAKLGVKCGIPNLNGLLHSGQVVGLINGTELIESDFDDATVKRNDYRYEDVCAVSSGDYSVGAAQTYATATSFFADIANLTGALSGTVKAAFTASAAADGTEALGGYELKFTSDTPSLGNYSTGHLVTITYTGSMINLSFEGAGSVVIENQRCIRTVNGASNTRGFIRTYTVTTGFTNYCRNNLYNGNSMNGGFYRTTDSDVLCYVYNNIACDLNHQMILNNTIYANSSSIFANNTALNCGTSGVISGSGDETYENDVMFGSTTSDFNTITGATGNNTAASDATNENGDWFSGSNNLSSLTPGDEFESLVVGGGDDFCLPKTTGSLYQGGKNPTIPGHTTYINGVSIVTDDVDIGAKGLVRGVIGRPLPQRVLSGPFCGPFNGVF